MAHPRAYWVGAFAACIFLAVQVGALALVPTFYDQGYQTVDDPSDPTNSLLYVGAILVATAVMLAAFRYDFEWAVRGLVVFTSGLLSWYVFAALVPATAAAALAASVAAALIVHPEWYVIDVAGVLMGAGAAGLFGISFGPLPAVVLLAVLAVYDAVSVYGTEHMLSLAEGVMDLRIPVVLVVPMTLSYSFLADGADERAEANGDEEPETAADAAETAQTSASSTANGGQVGAGTTDESTAAPDALDRDALFIGLGDAVMPTVLVASAAFFSPAHPLGFDLLPALNLPALLAMTGTLAGLAVLLRAVLRGNAHAGLPLLNGGAIGGYLLGSLLAGVPLLTALGI